MIYTGSDAANNLFGLEQWQEAVIIGAAFLITVGICIAICLVIHNSLCLH